MSHSMEELPAIPSILLQTFPLEAYLRSLCNKLTDNINALHCSVVGLQGEVKSCSTMVTDIRQFLRQQALLELREKIVEGCITLQEGVSVESLLPGFLRDDLTIVGGEVSALVGHQFGEAQGQGDNELGDMRSFMEKVGMERAERSRRKEEWEQKAHQQNEESRKQLEQMCEALQVSQKQYMDELERITAWLLPSPTVDEEDEALRSGGSSHRNSETVKDNSELQDILRSAPLLVEFRRVILCDMMDRLGEARDEQSMNLGNSIASLRDELRKEMGCCSSIVAAGGVGAGGGGSGEVERRLKAFDRNYMQRGEVVATLQDKADLATVAQKVDKAYVSDLEKRLLERIADLEERLTIYEAERVEFRRILRSVVDVHRRGEDVRNGNDRSIHSSRHASGRGGDNGATQTARILPNFVVVDEAIEPRHGREFQQSAVPEPRAPRRPPASRAKQSSDFKSSPVSARQQQQRQHPPSDTADAAVDVERQLVGLTVNQEAYANYVSRGLNRRVVESLPPLPYERWRG
ncbi:hypothetical protein TraAM80_08398 [Trypanosoma rangeli]|uniref:Uncharacterized protein n=1 Tax=Trypanosoma rangeli TaxID=5698 RepID=A0A422N0Y7_TRYRA|nr:uncharacterized protein TraAM80_08398 [Trypanosoma rangeli]RNE99110.1 hypothetical protein TraAM80_08398 [Trypanosoma rangeli]|eukprot:RNE99110.1 hypothetical protein TraAM80_08398 [Trypanosoma rangeli]